jgi:hypothetical protein
MTVAVETSRVPSVMTVGVARHVMDVRPLPTRALHLTPCVHRVRWADMRRVYNRLGPDTAKQASTPTALPIECTRCRSSCPAILPSPCGLRTPAIPAVRLSRSAVLCATHHFDESGLEVNSGFARLWCGQGGLNFARLGGLPVRTPSRPEANADDTRGTISPSGNPNCQPPCVATPHIPIIGVTAQTPTKIPSTAPCKQKLANPRNRHLSVKKTKMVRTVWKPEVLGAA